jgi:hypothetical protein
MEETGEAEVAEEDVLYQQARDFEKAEKERLDAGMPKSELPSAAQLGKEYDKKEKEAEKLVTLSSEPATILDANAKLMGNLLPAIFKAHVEVPTQKDIEAALLHRKKMELIKQYVSDELMETEAQTEELMGLTPTIAPMPTATPTPTPASTPTVC